MLRLGIGEDTDTLKAQFFNDDFDGMINRQDLLEWY